MSSMAMQFWRPERREGFRSSARWEMHDPFWIEVCECDEARGFHVLSNGHSMNLFEEFAHGRLTFQRRLHEILWFPDMGEDT